MVRTPSVDINGIRRGAWSEEEDNILKAYVLKHGKVNWRQLPRFTGLARCGKSCRLRWKNYLKPGIKRGNYTKDEVKQIIKLHQEFGNKWSLIASKLSGRTDNEIKNYWHTHLKNPTKHGLIISTDENVENLDQIHVVESMEEIISSSKAVDSFPQPQVSSSLEHWDSIDSFQAFEEFCHEPFLFNTLNDLTTQSIEPFMLDTSNSQISPSTIYTLGLSDEVARSFGSEPFMLDTLNTQIPASSTIYNLGLRDEVTRSFGSEPFSLDTLNNQIPASSTIYNLGLSDEVARCFGSEPFSLDTLNNQISTSTIYGLGLSDEIARRFASEPFTLDTLNNQILTSTNSDYALSSVDWNSWTQPMLMDASSNESIFSSAISNIEECMVPFMPLETGESGLINLYSAVYSLNGDEYQNKVSVF